MRTGPEGAPRLLGGGPVGDGDRALGTRRRTRYKGGRLPREAGGSDRATSWCEEERTGSGWRLLARAPTVEELERRLAGEEA